MVIRLGQRSPTGQWRQRLIDADWSQPMISAGTTCWEFIRFIYIYAYYLNIISISNWRGTSCWNYSSWKTKDRLIRHGQCHVYWRLGDEGSQGISNNCIDLVLPEYSGLSPRGITLLKGRPLGLYRICRRSLDDAKWQLLGNWSARQ